MMAKVRHAPPRVSAHSKTKEIPESTIGSSVEPRPSPPGRRKLVCQWQKTKDGRLICLGFNLTRTMRGHRAKGLRGAAC
jgi:hypothetical protein